MRLKTLSLWQPHATLCVTPSRTDPEVPAKPIETRHWKTDHRGWLGIHSAMKKDLVYRNLCQRDEFKTYIPDFDQLPFGHILGMVEISGCESTNGLHDSELNLIDQHPLMQFVTNCCYNEDDEARIKEILKFGNFDRNRYGFTISDYVAFTNPIKATGAQGFWYYDMPNRIGSRVLIYPFNSDSIKGIVVDYNSQRPQTTPISAHCYQVRLDDGSRGWYTEEGIMEIDEPPPREKLLGLPLFGSGI